MVSAKVDVVKVVRRAPACRAGKSHVKGTNTGIILHTLMVASHPVAAFPAIGSKHFSLLPIIS
jgi:hypothetical protein